MLYIVCDPLLVRLLIQAGNDVRAQRILLSRLVHRTPIPPGSTSESGDELLAEGAMDRERSPDIVA